MFWFPESRTGFLSDTLIDQKHKCIEQFQDIIDFDVIVEKLYQIIAAVSCEVL